MTGAIGHWPQGSGLDCGLRTQPPLFKYKHSQVNPAAIQALRDEAVCKPWMHWRPRSRHVSRPVPPVQGPSRGTGPRRKHAANGNKTHLFFTGSTGFIGHEFLFQASHWRGVRVLVKLWGDP